MSSYIVGNIHTHALIRFYERIWCYDLSREALLDMEQLLIDANYKSVSYRCKEEFTPYKAIWLEKYPMITPVEAIKACHCLEYQSCDFVSWEFSKAYELLQDIIRAACRLLPGYEAAQWEITR